MPTASATGRGCRWPLDVLPALHIRTSDFRCPISAAEDDSYRTSRLFKQLRGRLLVRRLFFCPFYRGQAPRHATLRYAPCRIHSSPYRFLVYLAPADSCFRLVFPLRLSRGRPRHLFIVEYFSLDERIEINRLNWNERTPIHATSEMYNVEGFKAGRITLNDIELEEIGPVAGRSLLHLQCHFGMGTMSWARLGADVTGVDLSDASIDLANQLNDELALGARFIRSNVYDLPNVLHQRFDIVYTGLGALCWLPDLTSWGKIIASYLKPGGTFYLLDEHPIGRVYGPEHFDEGDYELKPNYSYFLDPEGHIEQGERQTYTGSGSITTSVYEWQHSMSEIVNSILGAGLRIEFLHEYPFSFFKALPTMRHRDGWWRLDEYDGNVPFMLSIKATG